MDRERFAQGGADEQMDGWTHERLGEGLTDMDERGWIDERESRRGVEVGKMGWKGDVGMDSGEGGFGQWMDVWRKGGQVKKRQIGVGGRSIKRWMANDGRMNEMGVFMQLLYYTLKWCHTGARIGGGKTEIWSIPLTNICIHRPSESVQDKSTAQFLNQEGLNWRKRRLQNLLKKMVFTLNKPSGLSALLCVA